MKLSEKMKEKQLLSFELFPPKTEKGMANLPGTIEHLMEFKLKRPGGIKWLCVCTATAIFRCIHGNRNDGHRSCQCDHRNQPFP